jgi:hypothetical protein
MQIQRTLQWDLPRNMCKPTKRNVADRNISTTEACISFSVSVNRISETPLSNTERGTCDSRKYICLERHGLFILISPFRELVE